ncbi:hypothetical protein FA13DRAFT_1733743 [Coprinellus micaceus]|uniref:Nephrocystin 3-like N-terminal domain-containing protein n=1 Tax=Coprinellus micaceus TaxID=71717 RepID=A0A4Y7T906_COPMI|nr:hypothetical protein FA13DRAFT_1733743 [Coprinellus micaceus]
MPWSLIRSCFGPLLANCQHSKEYLDSEDNMDGQVLSVQARRRGSAQSRPTTGTSPIPDGRDPYACKFPPPRPSADSSGAGLGFLSNAHHFTRSGLHVTNVASARANKDGWAELLEHSAPNALHNSRHRFDPPKCDDDTRVEVIGELVSWIQDRDSPTRLLCMTGAAGSGKSALQQSVAEKCEKVEILGSSFFFSSTDHTRNNTRRLITTISYQLGLTSPTLRDFIIAAVEKDSLISTKSMGAQIDALIVEPLAMLRRLPDGEALLKALPHAILIDGLDECLGKERQAELLMAIQEGFLDRPWIPFRVFIASRPEWAIRTAIEPHGHLHALVYHIRLSEKYDATADIRRTLRRKLGAIGNRSSDPRARRSLWPSEEDLEMLVEAASGQCVYADTIMRYICDRHSSPVERLRVVLTWRPDEGQRARPFAALDFLYTNILVAARDAYEAVDTNGDRNFLVLFNALHLHTVSDFQPMDAEFRHRHGLPLLEAHDPLLGLETGGLEILLSDVRSLVAYGSQLKDGRHYQVFHWYHKSLHDFLESESRAGDLFVSPEKARGYLVEVQMRYFSSVPWEAFKSWTFHRWEEVLDLCAWCLMTLFRAFGVPGFSDSTLVPYLHRFRADGGLARIGDFFALPNGNLRTSTAHSLGVQALSHALSVLETQSQDQDTVGLIFDINKLTRDLRRLSTQRLPVGIGGSCHANVL